MIDCKYTALNIELIQFQIDVKDSGLYLVLIDLSKPSPNQLACVVIQHDTSVIKPDFPIPDPPRKLLNWLSHSSESEFNAVTTLRRRLLSFDPRMKEIVDTESIFYGKSKSHLCCEIRKQKKSEAELMRRYVLIFLWLPSPEFSYQHQVWRMYIDPNKDYILAQGIYYCQRKVEIKEMWHFPGFYRGMGTYRKMVDAYEPILDEAFNCSLEHLTNLALQTWLLKL